MHYRTVIDYDAENIAQQLTLIDSEIYKDIDKNELLKQAWNRDKYKYISTNVRQLIQRTNRLSYWVATNIILQKGIKERVKAITLFINVAKKLWDLNNYNSLISMVAGLSITPISRLKLTFNKVNKTSADIFNSIQLLVSPSNSYKTLRETIEKGGSMVIPYIGIYLKDLTFMDENANFVGEEQLINFPKYKMIYDAIDKLCRYQMSLDYQFQKNELYDYMFELPSMNEKDLYNLSYELEPKQQTTVKEN